MSPARLLAALRELRPTDHAASRDYARRIRIEWRILRALERAGHLRPLDGRRWSRAQLLEELDGPATVREPRGFVLVVHHDARGEGDTVDGLNSR